MLRRPGIALLLLAAAGCPSAGSHSGPGGGEVGPGGAPRTSEGVAAALARAQDAFIAGNWGEAVVEANHVIEGAATPDEYYAAVKIVGLASCNRRDRRPVTFAWSRLLPADRESLRNQCAQNGLQIADDGRVSP